MLLSGWAVFAESEIYIKAFIPKKFKKKEIKI